MARNRTWILFHVFAGTLGCCAALLRGEVAIKTWSASPPGNDSRTVKIEGRQKGPQYVATATGGYRRWVDAITGGADRKAAEKQLAQDLLAMALSYTRGFSDGFLAGSDHQTLVEGRFPKHRGVYVGRVARVVRDH